MDILNYLNTIFTTIQSNPIVAGIFGTTLIGGILVWCRRVPLYIYNLLKSRMTINITLNNSNDQGLYDIITECIGENKLYSIFNNFILVNKFKFVKLYPGYDSPALVKLYNIWCIITTSQIENATTEHIVRQISLTFLTKNKTKVTNVINKILDDYYNNKTDKLQLIIYNNGHLKYIYKPKLNIEKSVISPIIKNNVFSVLDNIIYKHNEYSERNIIAKEGLLFYGIPGCGKSHLASIIASHYNLALFYLNLNSFSTESEFISTIINLPDNIIILIEDIDCQLNSNITRNNKNNKDGISLSTLLNVLDGILSKTRQIVIVTTNDFDKLDKALIRDGRFNTKIEFKPFNKEQIKEFINKFFNNKYVNTIDYINTLEDNISMAPAKLNKICKNNLFNNEDKFLKQFKNGINE